MPTSFCYKGRVCSPLVPVSPLQKVRSTNLAHPLISHIHRLGEEHRKFRKLLTPAFSAAHMREMIPIFNRVTHQVRFILTGAQVLLSKTAL